MCGTSSGDSISKSGEPSQRTIPPFSKISASAEYPASRHQRHDEQHQEYEEQNSCELRRRARDTAKAERCSDQGNQQKNQCVVKHYSVASKLSCLSNQQLLCH